MAGTNELLFEILQNTNSIKEQVDFNSFKTALESLQATKQLKIILSQSGEDNPIIKRKIDGIGLPDLSFQRVAEGLFHSTQQYPILIDAYLNNKLFINACGWGDDNGSPRVVSAVVDQTGIICVADYFGNDNLWAIFVEIEIFN